MNNLNNKKCVPCNGNTKSLTPEQKKFFLNELNNWQLNDSKDMIFKKYNFKNFKKTLEFVNQIGAIAEKESHHPDISLGWGYCLIMIHTHAIKELSENDFILASKIDQIS